MPDKMLPIQLEPRRVPDDTAGRGKLIEEQAAVIRRLVIERNELLARLQRLAQVAGGLLDCLNMESECCAHEMGLLETELDALAQAGYIERL